MITKEIKFKKCFDGSELTQFIEDNSDKDWNTICDIEQEFELFDEKDFGYISYNPELNIYNPTENKLFYQDMINKFYEAHNLDTKESFIVLFSD